MTRSERIEKLSGQLVDAAVRDGRWEAPLGWWGSQDPMGMVTQDLEYLVNGAEPDDLYSRCIDGADESDHPSWRQYVDDLAAAASEVR